MASTEGADQTLTLPTRGTEARGRALYKARSRLLGGETILITADGPGGRDAFQVQLPGGTAVVRSGWFALRRLTGAPTLPVLAHQEGRHQVITIHPALPSVTPNPVDDLDRCREAITPLLERFVREHPEQCYTLTFPRRGQTTSTVRVPSEQRPRPGTDHPA